MPYTVQGIMPIMHRITFFRHLVNFPINEVHRSPNKKTWQKYDNLGCINVR